MAQKDVGNKVPIYKLKKTEEVMKYYDEWGEGNKYDKDMVDWNYTGPKETSEVFNKHSKDKTIKIFDVDYEICSHDSRVGEILELSADYLSVRAGDGIVKIRKLQFPGGKQITASDLKNSNSVISKNIKKIFEK